MKHKIYHEVKDLFTMILNALIFKNIKIFLLLISNPGVSISGITLIPLTYAYLTISLISPIE